MPDVAEVQPTQGLTKPSWWRYHRAKATCIEDGKAPTTVAIAKQLGISRINVWRLLKRHVGLESWSDGILRAGNIAYWGSVERRMAMLGMAGSTAHAEVYCRMQAGAYARGLVPGSDDGSELGKVTATINILVPRPELPAGGVFPQSVSPLQLAARPDIPTLAIR